MRLLHSLRSGAGGWGGAGGEGDATEVVVVVAAGAGKAVVGRNKDKAGGGRERWWAGGGWGRGPRTEKHFSLAATAAGEGFRWAQYAIRAARRDDGRAGCASQDDNGGESRRSPLAAGCSSTTCTHSPLTCGIAERRRTAASSCMHPSVRVPSLLTLLWTTWSTAAAQRLVAA